MWTRTHADLAAALLVEAPERIVAQLDGVLPGVDPATWHSFAARLREHLATHGHTVYTLDVATPVPADDPAPLVSTLRFYLDGGNFYTIQATQVDATTWANAVDHPFFIIFDLAMGGGFPGAFGGGPTAATVSGGQMKIDYLAVYTSR